MDIAERDDGAYSVRIGDTCVFSQDDDYRMTTEKELKRSNIGKGILKIDVKPNHGLEHVLKPIV